MDKVTKRRSMIFIAVLIVGWMIYKMPEYYKQQQEYQNSRLTIQNNDYVKLANRPINKADSVTIENFYDQLHKIELDIPNQSEEFCSLKKNSFNKNYEPRIVDFYLLDFVFNSSEKMNVEERKNYFYSIDDSHYELNTLGNSLGDGFKYEFQARKYHQGFLNTIKYLDEDKFLFVFNASLIAKPKYTGDKEFEQGLMEVMIYCYDITSAKCVCVKKILATNDKELSSIPLKDYAMDELLLKNLHEITARNIRNYCSGLIK